MKRNITLAMAVIALGGAPGHAGFFLEGLQPYSGDYCGDADPALTDPLISQPIDWSVTSADATSLGGRVPYTAENCVSGKGAGVSHRAPRVFRQAPLTRGEVPQK